MDKGLTIAEMQELLEYIRENNGLENPSNALKARRKIVKYVDFGFDSRTGTIWRVQLHQSFGSTVACFRTERDYNLKEAVYNWLDDTYDSGLLED